MMATGQLRHDAARHNMKGLKRYIHPGLVLSIAAHLGLVLLGLFLYSANSAQTMPPPEPAEVETVPPEATVVDIVPPDEAPRFSGTPSEIHASGSKTAAEADNPTPSEQPPPPRSTAQAPQQPQQQPNPQQHEQPPATQPRGAKPEIAAAETAPPDLPQPDKTADASETKTADQPPPDPTRDKKAQDQKAQDQPTPQQPTTADMVAQMAIVGGRLGGGFEAPPVDTNRAGYDFTTEFRERLSSCSHLPDGMSAGERVSITLHVTFNRDGTIAAPPQPLEPVVNAKQRALLESALSALQRCQPFTMLPPDKYRQWKALDLTIYPMNMFHG